jgi:predicted oxidoreductase (fatty acid repression mutant protein)
MEQNPLKSKFVEHVLKYRPDSITAQLAREVLLLRGKLDAVRSMLKMHLESHHNTKLEQSSDRQTDLSDR